MTPWIEIAGWTLVHFTWQGALAGCGGAAALHLLRRSTPQARYVTACAVLAAMLVWPVVTARTLAMRTTPAPAPSTAAPVAPVVGGSALASAAAVTRNPSPPDSRPMATPSPSGAPADGWLPFVVLGWLAGVVLLTSRMAGGWMRVRRLHRASIGAPPSEWEAACSRIGALLGVGRIVRVVDSPFVDTPTVLGWVRPVILLPVAALANLSPSQVDAILAHEIAHIRRHDYVVNLFQAIAETLLFYHPAVWWISARIRDEREHCCDVVAVGVCGDAVSYAEALAELETWRTSDVTLAVAATGGSLLARIHRLLAAPVDDTPRVSGAISIVAVALAVLIAAGAALYVSTEKPEARQDVATAPQAAAADAVSWRMMFRHTSGELLMMGYTARDLIRFAYQIPKARVLGGPEWLDHEASPMVVDLDGPIGAGLLPQGAHISQVLEVPAADQMPAIVRRVLEDRFQLQVHMERRDLPAYALVTARSDASLGPNLRISTIDCFDLQAWIAAGQPPREPRPNAQRQPVCGEEAWDSTISRTSFIAITMPQLAAEMRGIARIGPRFAGRELLDVVDRTGLAGKYDADIHAFLPTAALMAHYPIFKVLLEPIGLPSMDRALEQQLGLKLVETTAPYDVIVIDHAQRPAG